MAVLTWNELVALVGLSPDPEPTLRGTIRSVHGADVSRRGHGYTWSEGEPLPVFAAHGVGQSYDVWRDGDLVRMQRPDGTPSLIVGREWCWRFLGGREPYVQVSPVSALRYGGQGTHLLWHQSMEQLVGEYARGPLGPVEATMFLGRPAWTVRLGPPSGKQFETRWVVDAETGLLLADVNETAGSVDEWTALAIGEPLDPALFTYDGPAVTDEELQAARMAEHEALMAGRRAWFEANVIALPLRVEVESEVNVHEWDDETGAFAATIGETSSGSLNRRPRSDEPWDLRFHGDVYQWSDEQWDWALRTHEPLTRRGLDQLKQQLSRLG